MIEKKTFITLLGAIKIILFDLLIGILLLLVFQFAVHILKIDSNSILWAGLTSILSLVIVINIIRRKQKIELVSNMAIGDKSIKFLIPLVASILGLNIIIAELTNYLLAWFPMSNLLESIFNEFLGEDVSLLESFIVVAVIAPITEETLMRGIILKGLLKKYTLRKSIIYSAILFALIHGNIYQFPIAITMGVLLGWIFVRTKSLSLCIIFHAFNNSIGYIVKLLHINISGYTIEGFQPLWFTFFGSMILLIGLVVLKNQRFFYTDDIQTKNKAIEIEVMEDVI